MNYDVSPLPSLMVSSFISEGEIEEDLPGFFVRVRLARPAPNGPQFTVVQVEKAKVLMHGTKVVVGLYVNPGNGLFRTIKVSMQFLFIPAHEKILSHEN